MRRVWRHMRALWPRHTLLAPAPFVVWSAAALVFDRLRWELLALLFLAPALAYTNAKSKQLLLGIYPVGLVGLLYDAMRFVKNVGVRSGDIHTCDLQQVDARLFGVWVGGRRESLCDWFLSHSSVFLDMVSAIPYGTFIFAILGYAFYLYVRDPVGLKRFSWAFLFLNIAGFVTYHVYPAAPPWYVHQHGCDAVLAARASAGPGLTRVDAILGVPYFAGFYGRSNDVFGAVPSLHAAYPLLILLHAWSHHGPLGRGLALLFLSTMCFAAVYLDHHWAIDVVLGLGYAIVAHALTLGIFRPPPLPSPTPS